MAKKVTVAGRVESITVPDDATDDEILELVNSLDDESSEPIQSAISTPVAKVNEPKPKTKSNIFGKLTQPLTTAPSEFATSVADYIDAPSPDRSPMMARIAGFGAGALQGIGDLISQSTSPVDLATMALSGGSSIAAKTGLNAVSRGLRTAARIPSTGMIVSGAEKVIDPNSELSDRGTGLAEIAGGVIGMRGNMNRIASSPINKTVDLAPAINNVNRAKAKQIIKSYEGSLAAHLDKTDEELIAYAESLEPGFSNKPGKITPVPEEDFTPDANVNIKLNRKGEKGQTNTALDARMPQTIILKGDVTPERVKLATSKGYEYLEDTPDGRMKFKYTGKKVDPVLEGEVGLIKPTPSAAHKQLGPLADKVKENKFIEGYNLSRGLMASLDFSAPFRQGIGLVHKKEFWKAMPDMFRAAKSEEGFRAIQDSIAERPLFKPRVGPKGKVLPSFAEQAGLKLTDLTDLSKREEAIMSTWAEKVPGVRGSNRAYTAFLNKLRADTFETLIKDGKVFGADGETNIVLSRELANFVNTATGRGDLGKLEKSAVTLNSILFSPRLIASRLQLLAMPFYTSANPMVRKEALKSLFAIAAVGNAVGQLGKLAGGEVDNNPNSSDFGKLKIGDTRIDPYAGFQQYIVAANRLMRPNFAKISGMKDVDTGFVPADIASGYLGTGGQEVTSSTSGRTYDLWNPKGPFDPTHAKKAMEFMRGKSHPVIGFIWSLMSGRKEMSGKPMNFSTLNPMENALAQRFIPILLQDLYELQQADPALIPLAIPAAFGVGIQHYGQ